MLKKLKTVAKSFFDLQATRHTADYDNSKNWSVADAIGEVELAESAFAAWDSIRATSIAQDYLVSLLIKPRG